MKVAIIGLGMAVKPHALALAELAPKVEVAAAFSPTAARREAFATQTGFPVVDRLEVILDDASIPAVLVLTPPATHLQLVRRFVAAGKHLFV